MAKDGSSDNVAAPGVSFTFQKRTKPVKLKVVSLEATEEKEFVYSLVGKQIESSAPIAKGKKEYVIPLRKTKWRFPGNRKEGEEIEKELSTGAERKELIESGGEVGGKSQEEMELDREAVEAVWKDVRKVEAHSQEAREDHMIPLISDSKQPLLSRREKNFTTDIQLPESSNEVEYEDMPVEEMGVAMLRGMGWKKGEAIGKTLKGLVEPIEFLGNLRTVGLGAVPKPPPSLKKNEARRIKKPGEQDKKIQRPYIDKDGKVRHFKNIDEEIQEPVQGFAVGNYAKVVVGPHEDLYGKIVMVNDIGQVFLKLVINEQVERFGQHYLELVSREEYRLGRPPSNVTTTGGKEGKHGGTLVDGLGLSDKKQYGLIRCRVQSTQPKNAAPISADEGDDRRRSSDAMPSGQQDSNNFSSRLQNRKRLRTDNIEDGGTRSHYTDQRGRLGSPSSVRGSDNRSRDDESHRHSDHHYRYSDHRHGKHKHRREKSSRQELSKLVDGNVAGLARIREQEPEEIWLCRDLMVKMVDRHYKKGRYYNSKVSIVEVLREGSCVCQTSDGLLLEGVSQTMLETVVPKASYSSVVKVVRGKQKSQLALVIDQDRERATAVVQLSLSKDVLSVDFDDICQYVGNDADDGMI